MTALPAVAPRGPEALFRVGPVRADGEVVRASMAGGAWTLAGDGTPAAGSLGVLLDDVLGTASLLRRPPGHWSVTMELSIDVCRAVPTDGSPVHAEAWLLAEDGTGAVAQGRAVDDAGRLLATASTRGRYVPGVPDPSLPWPDVDRPDDGRRLPDLLGASTRRVEGGGVDVVVGPSESMTNPNGTTHGGLTTCLSEMAGLLALQDGGSGDGGPTPFTTAGIRMAMVRPTPTGVDLTFSARVVHRGRSFGLAHVIGGAVEGRPCTVATVTAHAAPS